MVLYLAAFAPRAFSALVSDPVIEPGPAGDSGWVGTTYFTFNPFSASTGKIMYTLDGSAPQKDVTASTYRYQLGTQVLVDTTLTVRAIHVVGGSVSNEVSAEFVRAKVPKPVAHYGGVSPHFYPALTCSLTVGAKSPSAVIRYTLNDSSLGPKSTVYGGTPLQLSKSTTLRAYATAAGYDDSDPLQVDFVLDPVATPTIDPPSSSFKTNTLTVYMKDTTAGAHIRYTIDPNLSAPEKWTLMTGDSVSFPASHDGDSIQLRAQAFVSAYQASVIQAAKYVYLPVVATPVFNPGPKTFYDTLTVRMSTSTAGASVRYTDDGSTPASTSPDGSAPVFLTRSDTLKARAFKDKHDPSAAAAAAYIMQLSQPVSDKPNGEFTGTLTIHLHKANPNAFIFYSLDGTTPVLQSNGTVSNGVQADSAGTVTLSQDGTTTVNAIAVAGGVSSHPAQFIYTRKTTITTYSTPSIDPVSREFFDTLSIRMTTPDSGAEIRYTLTAEGRDPTQQDSLAVSGRAILLDSSAVLRCRAFPRPNAKPGLLPSGINEMKYILRPSQPVASPPPSADPFPVDTRIVLMSHTKGGLIHYATDPNVDLTTTPGYPDSVVIHLAASATLYAETILGSGAALSVSSLLTAHYDILAAAPSDTLPVDGVRPVSGGFAYRNKSAQPVIARVHTADGMGLTGFSDLSLVVSLQAADSGQPLNIIFTKPTGSRVSLYRYSGGIVEFISGKDTSTVTLPGDYFTAIDISPPIISIEKQTAHDGDSTTVQIKVTDNVANPTCEIASPGLKDGATTRKPDANGIVNVNLKGSGNGLEPIWLRVVSRDAYDSTHLPREIDGKIFVAQTLSNVTTPGVLVIGQGQGTDLWDLAGLPVGAGPGLKWADLRKANPDMQACVWRNGGYDSLDDSDHIVQGMAFWLGSRTRHSNLNVPSLQPGESEGDGTYRIRLKHGWNQVTSPYLDTVYWPITPAMSHDGSMFLKAPYRFARGTEGKWLQTDTLAPWIGYFVDYFGEADTVITVYSTASARPLAKAAGEGASAKSAAGGPPAASIGLVFSVQGLPDLRLGARSWARDSIGPEDEPRPPAWGKMPSIWSRRGNGSLLTDLVHLQAGAVARWQVVVDPGQAGIADLHVTRSDLPPGYEAWAVSRMRGLKFRLAPGATLPAEAGLADTLSVYAGSATALAGIDELARAPERVGALAFALERGHGQAVLRIDLPWSGRVEADVWTISGRRVSALRAGELSPGIYRFPLLSGLRAETLYLRLRIQGSGGTQEFSRLLAP